MLNEIVLALMQLKGLGRKTIIKHITLSPDMPCNEKSITDILGESRKNYNRLKDFNSDDIKKAIDFSEKIIADCEKLNIKIITYLDSDYPVLLKKSADYPSVLYYKGDISYLDSMNAVAIIGTRKPSEYGERIAHKLGASFAENGFVDVSGLAHGCDTFGHRGCLSVGGKTVAVLAGGLDKIYPSVNTELADEIVEKGGALVSEYPPYSEPFRSAFVERDRIQAALSSGVVVVETPEKGGTFHAVRFAGDNNRLIGCFKHPMKYYNTNEASGNKMLIQNGTAIPLSDDSDLEAFRKMLHKKKTDILDNDNGFKQLTFKDILKKE